MIPCQQVLLLIDEFDYILRPRLRRSIPQDQLDQMIIFFEGFIEATVSVSNNPRAQVVLAGSFPDPALNGQSGHFYLVKDDFSIVYRHCYAVHSPGCRQVRPLLRLQ
jgi:hypothetical protein